jgi:hypothetical protein
MNTDLTSIPRNASGLMPRLPEQPVTSTLQHALENIRDPHPDVGLPAG